MNFDWTSFLAALGLACVLEALPWLIAPERMRRALQWLFIQPGRTLRGWGLFLLALGLILVWIAKN